MSRTFDATFLRRGRCWVAWCEAVPGALTQGRTLAEARENLRDAIRLMLAPASTTDLPKLPVVRRRVRV
jgi:predicted RNase H-like HicB family nuclease